MSGEGARSAVKRPEPPARCKSPHRPETEFLAKNDHHRPKTEGFANYLRHALRLGEAQRARNHSFCIA